MKVAIIGGGVSGLGALWALQDSDHDAHLYEASPSIGGHANTAVFEHNGERTDVDTGFIAFNETNYPNFSSLLRHLNVPSIESSISFSLSRNHGQFEWSGQSPSTFFAQRRRLLSFRHWRMIFDFVRFNHFALDVLRKGSVRQNPETESITSYLERNRYSKEFRDDFLIPMCAAIWSTPLKEFSLHFPAETLVRYLWNHQLLSATKAHPTWRTIKGGSRVYIDTLRQQVEKSGRCAISTETPVTGLKQSTSGSFLLKFESGDEIEYDHVIFTTHADVTRRILGDEATPHEAGVLDRFTFTDNEVVLHSDVSLMPKHRRVWAGWNYLTTTASSSLSKRAIPICVTFWMNCLQQIPSESFGPVLVTLNPSQPPASHLVQGRWEFRHPLFSVESMEAQRLLPSIQNQRGISFAGAWTNFGFHEDGFSSGVRVAVEHLGGSIPFEFTDSNLLWWEELRMGWRMWFGRMVIYAVLVYAQVIGVMFFPFMAWWRFWVSVGAGLAEFLVMVVNAIWSRRV